MAEAKKPGASARITVGVREFQKSNIKKTHMNVVTLAYTSCFGKTSP